VNLFRERFARIGLAVAVCAGFIRRTTTARVAGRGKTGPVHCAAPPLAPAEDTVVVAISTLFAQHLPGDFVTVELMLREGWFTRDRLVGLLRERVPGYDPYHFVRALAELPKIPDEEFRPYGLDDQEIAVMRARFADWFHALIGGGIA
jgi:hypothetical protein